jgi:hypothetical protein
MQQLAELLMISTNTAATAGTYYTTLKLYTLQDYGVRYLCSPEFRTASSTNSTLFWNLVVHMKQYALPITWLLAGPFAGSVLVPALFL